MGKLFKVDLVEEEELYIGYKQRKAYQQFRRNCKAKLKMMERHKQQLHHKYFGTNRSPQIRADEVISSIHSKHSNHSNSNSNGNSNHNGSLSTASPITNGHHKPKAKDPSLSIALPSEMMAELQYYDELNLFATKLWLSTRSKSQNGNNDSNKMDKEPITNTKATTAVTECKSNGTTAKSKEKKKGTANYISYRDYEAMLRDIAYNDNTPNFDVFRDAFQSRVPRLRTYRDSNGNLKQSTWQKGEDIYCCIRCGMHLTKRSLVMDTHFFGRTGKSYLIQSVFNVDIGAKQERKLRTGKHVVSDIFCRRCASNVGWYYHESSGDEQKYKISHYVLECKLVCPFSEYVKRHYHYPSCWEPSLDLSSSPSPNDRKRKRKRDRIQGVGMKQKQGHSDGAGDGDNECGDGDGDDPMHDVNHLNDGQYRRPLPPWMRDATPRRVSGMYPNRSRDENVYRQRGSERKEEESNGDESERNNDCEEEADEKEAQKRRFKGNRYRKGPRGLSARNRNDREDTVLRPVTGRDNDVNVLTDSSNGRRGSIKSDSSNDSSKVGDDEEDKEQSVESGIDHYDHEEDEEEDDDDWDEDGDGNGDGDEEEESVTTSSSPNNGITETESNEVSEEETAERVSSMEEDADHEHIEELDVD